MVSDRVTTAVVFNQATPSIIALSAHSGNLGLGGPDVLAGRLADLLPGDLLNSLNDQEVDVPGGVQGLINNVPPEVLNLMVGFLGGEGLNRH